jgi:hypothetical protein
MTTETAAKKIEVTVVIDFGSINRQSIQKSVSIAGATTVLDALRSAVPVMTSCKFGMDHFIESICGVANDYASDRAWNFDVNGYRSNVPAERYLVKAGDWIEWCYIEGS